MQGRAEGGDNLKTLMDYIHLNAVRARLVDAGYVKAARNFVNPAGSVNIPGGNLVSWSVPGQGKTCFLDIVTKRFGVKVDATGEIATFFVSNEKNSSGALIGLLQWAKNRGYPALSFP